MSKVRSPSVQPEPLDFRTGADWRQWLGRNHAKSSGVWVYMYKGGAKIGLRYREALDEALCFGWIDGIVRGVDADRFMQRWTPRRPKSIWSQTNKARVKWLTAEGRMCDARRKSIANAKRTGHWQKAHPNRSSSTLPPKLVDALRADPFAWQGFNRFAPSYRRLYARWVADARRAETRQRRIAAVVRRAREYRKPGIDSYYQ